MEQEEEVVVVMMSYLSGAHGDRKRGGIVTMSSLSSLFSSLHIFHDNLSAINVIPKLVIPNLCHWFNFLG